MPNNTLLPNACSAPIEICETVITDFNTQPESQSISNQSATSIDQLVAQWNTNPQRAAALTRARQWAAATLYAEQATTISTLRLKKGWSQAQLAAQLGTSQPHVARIERGIENLSLHTCRRLCAALEIDMSTLDQVLRYQESLLTQSEAE